MNALSYKEQLEKLSKLVRDSPLSQGEQTVWKLSASRTGFKRPTLLPAPKCLPISSKDVQGKLAVREATYKAAAPAKFISELQKQLARAKGRKTIKALLASLRYWRTRHIRFRRDNIARTRVPHLSKIERAAFLQYYPNFVSSYEKLPHNFFEPRTYASTVRSQPRHVPQHLLPLPPRHPKDSKRADCFEFSTQASSLPLPKETSERHVHGKRRIIRCSKFTEEFVY